MIERDEDEFPFDAWARLAREDPRAFEAARRQVLQSLIESAPLAKRRRLAGLQWQVDIARARATNPLAACLEISSMMWEAVLGEAGLVDGLDQLTGTRPQRDKPTRQAVVVPFAHRSTKV